MKGRRERPKNHPLSACPYKKLCPILKKVCERCMIFSLPALSKLKRVIGRIFLPLWGPKKHPILDKKIQLPVVIFLLQKKPAFFVASFGLFVTDWDELGQPRVDHWVTPWDRRLIRAIIVFLSVLEFSKGYNLLQNSANYDTKRYFREQMAVKFSR